MSAAEDGTPAGFRLDGKRALVTGASRGLGRAIAEGLAQAGAKVAMLARTASALQEVGDGIRSAGGEAQQYAGSVDSVADVRSAMSGIRAEWGGLDILVNNAGISPTFKRSESLEDLEWQQVIDVNLSGTFYCCREAAPLMMEGGAGSIINISSVHGVAGMERIAAYSAAKGGVEMLTRSLAVEWAERGIRVNAVAPGYLETAMTEGLRDSDRWREFLLERTPLRRFGMPDEVVPAVLFLARDESRYMTGTTIFVDGGWTAW